MKISKKAPAIAYTVIAVLLLVGLLTGIYKLTHHRNFNLVFGPGPAIENQIDGNIIWDENSSGGNIVWDSDEVLPPFAISDTARKYELDNSDEYIFENIIGDVYIGVAQKPYLLFDDGERDVSIRVNGNKIKMKTDKTVLNAVKNSFENSPKLAVYLPQDEFDKLDMDFTAGRLQMENVLAEELKLKASAGKVTVESSCVFEKIDSGLSAGLLQVYTTKETKRAEVSVNAGKANIYLPKNTDGFVVKGRINIGSITDSTGIVKRKHSERLITSQSIEMSYGDESCQISLDADVGNIEILTY